MNRLWMAATLCCTAACTNAAEFTPLLEKIVSQHELHLADIRSFEASWEVISRNDKGKVVHRETGRTLVSGDQQEHVWGDGESRQHIVWEGNQLRWMIGFDPKRYAADPRTVADAQGFIYSQDSMPGKRLLLWRMLLTFRLMAGEDDLTLRQLCNGSTSPVTVEEKQTEGGRKFHLKIRHLGTLAPGGLITHSGNESVVEIDPAHGYLASRVTTTLQESKRAPVLKATLQVKKFGDQSAGYLPESVEFRLVGDGVQESQLIKIEPTRVNEPIAIDRRIFPAGLVVLELERWRAGFTQPTGVFVVGKDGDLGQRFASERDASRARFEMVNQMISESGAASSTTRTAVIAGVLALIALLALVWISSRWKRARRPGIA